MKQYCQYQISLSEKSQVEKCGFIIILLLWWSFYRRMLSRPHPRRGTDVRAGFFRIEEYFGEYFEEYFGEYFEEYFGEYFEEYLGEVFL